MLFATAILSLPFTAKVPTCVACIWPDPDLSTYIPC
jgi:hypothetical protein